MNTQRTPDAMSTQAENELICEKLLGWRRLCHNDVTWWEPPSTGKYQPAMLTALSFDTWAEAGLIVDALAAQWPKSRAALRGLGGSMVLGGITPSEIRECALEYIRSQS